MPTRRLTVARPQFRREVTAQHDTRTGAQLLPRRHRDRQTNFSVEYRTRTVTTRLRELDRTCARPRCTPNRLRRPQPPLLLSEPRGVHWEE